MVFFQATARPTGAAARLFVDLVEGGRLALYVSDAIVEEVRDLVGRPRIRAKNPNIIDTSVEKFCKRVRKVTERTDPVPALFSVARDSDDELDFTSHWPVRNTICGIMVAKLYS